MSRPTMYHGGPHDGKPFTDKHICLCEGDCLVVREPLEFQPRRIRADDLINLGPNYRDALYEYRDHQLYFTHYRANSCPSTAPSL